jgi:hypothetical protein
MHVLIPDLLSNKDFLAEALKGLSLPGLEALLFNAKFIARDAAPDTVTLPVVRGTAAWRWLYAHCEHRIPVQDSPPHAAAWMKVQSLLPATATWHLLAPCHFAATSDHILLAGVANEADVLRLDIAESEALALTCAELLPPSAQLKVLNAQCWAYQDPGLGELLTSEPARATGRNIDLWLPADATPGSGAARAWRRLHNEIQMAWFIDPVNEARDARGLLPINGLWLYGGARQDDLPAAKWTHIVTDTHDEQLATLAAAWQASYKTCASAGSSIRSCDLSMCTPDTLLWLGGLSRATLGENIEAWRLALQHMDIMWLQPLANAGAELTLVLCGEHEWRELRTRAVPRWKQRFAFWHRISLLNELST